jgi:hypothetical protein
VYCKVLRALSLQCVILQVRTFVCRVGERLTDSTPSVVVATLALPDPLPFSPWLLEERLIASSEDGLK